MSQKFGSWELRLTEEGDLNENVDDDESSQDTISCELAFSLVSPKRTFAISDASPFVAQRKRSKSSPYLFSPHEFSSHSRSNSTISCCEWSPIPDSVSSRRSSHASGSSFASTRLNHTGNSSVTLIAEEFLGDEYTDSGLMCSIIPKDELDESVEMINRIQSDEIFQSLSADIEKSDLLPSICDELLPGRTVVAVAPRRNRDLIAQTPTLLLSQLAL